MKLRKLTCEFRDPIHDPATLKRIKRRLSSSDQKMNVLRYGVLINPFTKSIDIIFNDPIQIENKTAFMIGVYNYTPNGIHKNHAMAAKIIGDKMFFFNAWGVDSQTVDSKISAKLAQSIKSINGKKLSKIIHYKGRNFQAYNSFGVCVGYSASFILGTPELSPKMSQNDYSKYVEQQLNPVTLQYLENILQREGGNVGNAKDANGINMSVNDNQTSLKRKTKIGSNKSKSNSKMNVNMSLNKSHSKMNVNMSLNKSHSKMNVDTMSPTRSRIENKVRTFYKRHWKHGRRMASNVTESENIERAQKIHNKFKRSYENINFNDFRKLSQKLLYSNNI